MYRIACLHLAIAWYLSSDECRPGWIMYEVPDQLYIQNVRERHVLA